MFESVSIVEVPPDLAARPPGVGLCAALAAIELAAVPNDRMLQVLRAQYRQLCHEQARMAAVLAELGRCAGFPEPGEVRRLPAPARFAPEESRAALCWTRRAAADEHELAENVVRRCPLVYTAWLAGDLDRPRVRVFDRYLTGLSSAQVAGVCEVAVPQAAGLTTGQLAALLRRMVIAIDPDAAAHWYREAVAERNVIAYLAPDGTITLSAHGLPVDEAEAACTRLQELAVAAKRAGHPGPIGQIRADLFVGLLDGRFHHLTRDEVITALITDRRNTEGGSAQQVDVVETSGASESRAVVAEVDAAEPDQAGPAAPTTPAAARTVAYRPVVPDLRTAPARDERVGIEVRVALSTLLGLDEHPAEIPGLGPLPAPEARRRVGLQRRAQWRFALTDTDGRLVFEGITRRRPRGGRRDGPPGGIVELHIPVALLTDLAAGRPSAGTDWADVVADIAAQHATGDDHGIELDVCPDARLPGAALRRHTEIRDRTCTFVGCRHRAHTAQQDHTRDHQHGGPTTRANLGPLCPHDHRVKHDGGWKVEQTAPGRFLWRSPLGGRYRTGTALFLPPMPAPVPAAPRSDGQCVEPPDTPILHGALPAHSPDEQAARGDPDEPPPF